MAGARPSTANDVIYLAPRLRPEDVAEVKAYSGRDAYHTLSLGLHVSDQCWTMVSDDDEPAGMFGVVKSQLPGAGLVWMLCTPLVPENSMTFLKECRRGGWTNKLHRSYPILWNYVDERNTKHVNWLRWMGFSFIMRHPKFGFEQRPFLEFTRLNNDV
jgi:hypothetical protein